MRREAYSSIDDRYGIYACPTCRQTLRRDANTLTCPICFKGYPIIEDVPEFIFEELSTSSDPELRRMRFIDKMARIYETNLWYPIVMKVYGGFHGLTLPQLIGRVSNMIEPTKGRVLDIACGPGTFGRRVASSTREVWGIDVSRGMLRQGVVNTVKENISNVHFARARVEALPFCEEVFDAAICCGSLHLFTKTVIALREMARVMKPGGTLAVFTFTAGKGGILKYRRVRDWSQRSHGLHVFTIPELEECLSQSGFGNFEPKIDGSVLTFSAQKQ